MTEERIYSYWKKPEGKIKWDALTEEEKESIDRQQAEENTNEVLTMKDAKEMNRRRKQDIEESIQSLKQQYTDTEYESDTKLMDFENKKLEDIARLDGAAMKRLIAAISDYNVVQRQFDKLNPLLTRYEQNKYPCSSITCKRRGRTIKKALEKLSQYGPETLGQIGYWTRTLSFGDYMNPIKTRSMSDYKDQLHGSCSFNGAKDLAAIIKIAKDVNFAPTGRVNDLIYTVKQDPNVSTEQKKCWVNILTESLKSYNNASINNLKDRVIETNDSCIFINEMDIPKVITILETRYKDGPETKLETYKDKDVNDICFTALMNDCIRWARTKNITTVGELKNAMLTQRVKGNIPTKPEVKPWWAWRGGKTRNKHNKKRTRRCKITRRCR
jgi:hypothetical protein